MVEIVRTNDVGMIVFIEALLDDSDIPHQVADRTMAILDGSINAIRMRVLVPENRELEARQLLVDADLGEWLSRRR